MYTLLSFVLALLLVHGQVEDGCENVKCPADEICPDDSYMLPKLVLPDKCCGVSHGCACLPCTPPECQKGSQVKLEQQAEDKPGKCCAVYKCINETELRCNFEGQEFPNGHTWKKNKCQKCDCKDGVTLCESAECKPLPDCGRIEIPEGECCPACIGCVTSTGRFYNNTERWKEDDYCTSCECENGQVHCQAEMCHSACPHPVKIPGQCCSVCPDHTQTEVTLPPDCPSVDNCSIQCAAGLKKNENGCYECKCKLEDCNLNCLNGYSQDVNGQEICQCAQEENDCQRLVDCKKYCNHGYKLNKKGCPICKCSRCKKLKGCNLKCPVGFLTDGRDCPICKCKAVYDEIPTTASTTLVSMVTTTTRSIRLSDGTSCYSTEGQQYDEGETWHDGCRVCYCHGGQEMCALISCPVPTCEHPSVTAEDCCPQCLDDLSVPMMTVCQAIDGHHYVEGETWSMDSCTRCICHEGRVLCNTQQCSPTPCQNPVKKQGECCASCTGLIAEPAHTESNINKPTCYSDDERTAYQHGNSWRASICQSCTCQHGKIKCFSDSCLKPTCDRPVLRKNQCCPICLDKKVPSLRCESDDRIYNNGEKWNPSECVHCMCLNGRIKCTENQCSVDCDNPIHIEGECCPVCASKIPKRTDIPIIPKLEKSTPVITYLDDNDGFPGEEDGTFKIHTHTPQLSLMAVIVCCVIVIVLLVIITMLLCLLFKQRRQLRYKEQELKIARLKPRPKSTNLEFQGAMTPFLSSNGSVCLEKNKCANENEYTKPYMAPVNTYVAPVKNVV
uniref:VWFC domain-containing protein n=1 Tax=Strigamia maritima TaxID=126957 RepID=T1JCP8_STRMM